MTLPCCVTLLTDFGLQDEYVGVMKGVILSLASNAQIVDLCHQVAPQDVRGGALLLAGAYRFFPPGTVHVAVVDPGVGGQRRIVCLRAGGFLFLAPDNGLLTPILTQHPDQVAAWSVENPAYFLQEVSATFHGRDIFAPVAGRLCQGLDPACLGPQIAPGDLAQLPLPRPRVTSRGIVGQVVHVDRFGNLATNITADLLRQGLAGAPSLTVRLGDTAISGIATSYHQVPIGQPLALIASRGTLEIAVREGSAAARFQAGVGAEVRVQRR